MSEPVVEPDVDEPEKDEPEPYAPPSEAEWRRTQDALTKANAEAKNHRLKARELAEKQASAPGPKDEKAIRQAVESELAERYKAPAVRTAAKLALRDAGFVGSPSARVLAMIDLADCDVDSDGEVTGLDAQVREIKKDFPALFAPAAKRSPRVDGAEPRQAADGRKLSTAERIAAGVLAP